MDLTTTAPLSDQHGILQRSWRNKCLRIIEYDFPSFSVVTNFQREQFRHVALAMKIKQRQNFTNESFMTQKFPNIRYCKNFDNHVFNIACA